VNWLDIVLIVILILSIVMGMRTGLIKAAFTAVGIFIGWLLAGQFSGRLAEALLDNVKSQTLATIIAYAIIIVLAIVAANIAARIIKPILGVMTLGMTALIDKLGGAALGLIMGVLISGALVAMLARLTYDFEIPVDGIAGEIVSRAPQVQDVKGNLENTLLESSMIPAYLNALNWLPGNTIGLAPDSFEAALEELDRRRGEQP